MSWIEGSNPHTQTDFKAIWKIHYLNKKIGKGIYNVQKKYALLIKITV